MMKHKNFLSIGDFSKLSGSGIKALRYYDKVGVLKPAYTDEISGYRYYTSDQIYLLELIQFCVEIDIPIKELTRFIDDKGNINMHSFLIYSEKVAKEKLKTIQQGLSFVKFGIDEINRAAKLSANDTYTYESVESYFYVIPYTSYEEKSFLTMYSKLTSMYNTLTSTYNDEELEEAWSTMKYGVLHEYKHEKVEQYLFIEIPTSLKDSVSPIKVTGKRYYCQKHTSSQIENAPKLFPEIFNANTHLIVIETQIMTKHYQMNNPQMELSVIVTGK